MRAHAAQSLNIQDTFTTELPGDPRTDNSLRQARRRGGAPLVHWWRSLGCASAAPHPDPPLLASPRVSAQVTGAMYSFVAPTPANGDPVLVAASSDVAELLDLDPAEFNTTEFVRVFAGAAPFGRPWAMVYGGHQFGSWAGQLVRAELLCRVFSAV